MKKVRDNTGVYRTKLSFSAEELFRNTIVLGNAGFNMQLPKTKAKAVKALESLGFLGDGNNGNTFYPSLDVQKDVVPVPEDYVHVPFRLLSETIVAANTWRSTDFSRAGLLRAAVDKFVDKPLYFDHSTDTSNWLGKISSAVYSEGYVDAKTSKKIPGGVDGVLSIDAKSNPKFARGVLSGIVSSNSVTIDFMWKPSHPIKDYNAFEELVGTLDENGKMYTREAVEIVDIYETSLVFRGADPYAKRLDDNGKVTSPEFGSAVSLSLEAESIQNLYKDAKKLTAKVSFSKEEVISLRSKLLNTGNDKEDNIEMDEKLVQFLLSFFSVAKKEDLTEEMLSKFKLLPEGQEAIAVEALSALKADQTKLATVEAELATATTSLTTLEAEVTTLKADKESLTELAAYGKTFKELKLAKVESLYKKTVDTPNEAVLASFKSATPDALDGFLEQYSKKASHKFGAVCTKCSSTEVSFRSSIEEDEETTDEVVSEVKNLDYFRRKYKK